MDSVQAFFSTTREKLDTLNFNELTLIFGNESCDLDSAVSAVVYAMYLDWQYQHVKGKVCKRKDDDEPMYADNIFVPVLNVAREDYELKTEVAYCFDQHRINKAHLVFIDDKDLKELSKSSKVNVVLVDHHKIEKNLIFLTPLVTEIIDHRPLDQTDWNFRLDITTTIEQVGSCATLVAQRIKDLGAMLSEDVDFFIKNRICSDMLHSTIILDTLNFSREANKATARDEEMVLFLESILKPNNYEDDRREKLYNLMHAKRNISNLNVAQLLRKDTKIIHNVLVPSLPMLVEEYLCLPGALAALPAAIDRSNCDVMLLLGSSGREPARRDTAVYSEDLHLGSSLAKFIQDWADPILQLTTQPLPKIDEPAQLFYFSQKNLGASRKQYVTAVNAFFGTRKIETRHKLLY